MPDNIIIRRATPPDAEAAGRICFDAFDGINRQHNFPPEIAAPEMAAGLLGMLFSHPGFYAVVAEREGRIVGSNCLDERGPIAGIGPITVDPEAQNGGIGRLLMATVMDRAREGGKAGMRLLQAAFHNRSLSLYTKLGFDVREPISVIQGPPLRNAIGVRVATTEDLKACNELCERVHGFSRASELSEAVSQGSAKVAESGGRITGYAAGYGYFGHAVAETNASLQSLIAAAESFNGPGILVPTRNAELLRWCFAHGLRLVQPMTLMTAGSYQEPAAPYLPSILY